MTIETFYKWMTMALGVITIVEFVIIDNWRRKQQNKKDSKR